MPRKKEVSVTEQYCDDVLAKLTDTQEITEQQLIEIATEWCRKNYDHHRSFGLKHNLAPIALIIVALLWIEHPLLTAPGRGMILNIERAAAEILRCELLRLDVPIPVNNSINNQPVDGIGKNRKESTEIAQVTYIHKQSVERN
jgi:hypothetical protein